MRKECTRRAFLKASASGVVASAAALPSASFAGPKMSPPGEIAVWTTSDKQRFTRGASLSWKRATGTPGTTTIVLKPEKKFLKILGFGAAFTDSSCYLFNQLSAEARGRLLRELLHPSELGLSVCRTCIGSSDYATEAYSFDEGEPDPDLK